MGTRAASGRARVLNFDQDKQHYEVLQDFGSTLTVVWTGTDDAEAHAVWRNGTPSQDAQRLRDQFRRLAQLDEGNRFFWLDKAEKYDRFMHPEVYA